MRELTINEIDEVNGGVGVVLTVTVVIAVVTAGYKLGSDLAKRDNANNANKCSR